MDVSICVVNTADMYSRALIYIPEYVCWRHTPVHNMHRIRLVHSLARVLNHSISDLPAPGQKYADTRRYHWLSDSWVPQCQPAGVTSQSAYRDGLKLIENQCVAPRHN